MVVWVEDQCIGGVGGEGLSAGSSAAGPGLIRRFWQPLVQIACQKTKASGISSRETERSVSRAGLSRLILELLLAVILPWGKSSPSGDATTAAWS